MKTFLIAALLLGTAGAAQAQIGTQQSTGATAGASSSPGGMVPTAGAADPTTTKPKGEIITLKNGIPRRMAGVRAHCSDGTSYWNPELEEGVYYCEAKDAPNPANK